MWLVRPVQKKDLADLRAIVHGRDARISSTLAREEEHLARTIEYSIQGFSGTPETNGCRRFLFVLEDTEQGRVVGVAGIDARAGNGQPFYNYRRDALIHASHELGISQRVEVLYPSHALTDQSLLCSFLMAPDLAAGEAAELLSRTRMLFIAGHRQWFTDSMVVEIQGVQTATGGVPFWDSLGRHFFDMDFARADHCSSALSKTFIAELMPHNPIYVTLLSAAAREAIARPHSGVAGTFELLRREGFHSGDYIDIFDGGPVLHAHTDHLKTIATCRRERLRVTDRDHGDRFMVAAGEGAAFRATLAPVHEGLDGAARLPVRIEQQLGCQIGDDILVAPFQ